MDYIVDYASRAVTRAKNIMDEERGVVRIGTSPLNPARLLTELWPRVNQYCGDVNFQLIPFENSADSGRIILRNLGKGDIDVLPGIFDKTLLELYQVNGLRVSMEPICCAVSIYHPLAAKDRLTPDNLHGEDLLLIRRGWSQYMDRLRDWLEFVHPEIHITDFDHYDMGIFNKCEQERSVLTVIGKWSGVHPLLKILPVEWDHAIPFGIMYPRELSPLLRRFIAAVEKAINTPEEL